jgi:two-component system response regulator HydG
MSLRMQALMLRFLESGEIQRAGSERLTARVDVRVIVIAATNRDLPERIREGRFRQDLYYRLNVIRLAIPALRERPGTCCRCSTTSYDTMRPRTGPGSR